MMLQSSLKQKKQFAPIKNTWNRNADFKLNYPQQQCPISDCQENKQ